MRRFILTIAALAVCSIAFAQVQQQDDTPAEPAYDVFGNLSEFVTVHQSPEVEAAMAAHVERNARRTASGLGDQTYSIRIYFDSGQGARSGSEAAAAKFRNSHPGVPVSRTYSNPFFKVTVGNYSTKADASAALKSIQQEFPTAFIVRNQ
ncbi:MAG: SPOR domain-containing protein [Bacteroidales bacterium]|nr:SPOR domain-containing protein [Bacteroidales bacterium]